MMIEEGIRHDSIYDESELFLATTALEEFWDTSMPIVFLGRWCLRYSRRDRWEQLNAVVLPSPFKDFQELHKAYVYSSDVCERALKGLACMLNEIHGKHYSERYWRIVLGAWLFHYIDVLYDRYISLKSAFSKYPNLVTIGLTEECFLVAKDTLSHYNLLGDDAYNLQIYSRLFSAIGKERHIIKKNKYLREIDPPKQRLLSKLKFRSRRNLLSCLGLLYQLGDMRNYSIVSSASCFSRYAEFMLFLKTRGTFRPFIKMLNNNESFPINESLRSRVNIQGLSGNEFETILGRMLPHDIPQCFLEAYDTITSRMRENYPLYPKVILSAISSYFDEHFKQWAAEASENGTIVVGLQHGGNYGSDAFIRAMDHEIAVSDRFYSWGWNSAESPSKIYPMPATKLMMRRRIGANNRKEGVLFAGTAFQRYLIRIEAINNQIFPDYIDWQFRFFASLPLEMQEQVRVRIFYRDYGWDMYQRWKERFPKVVIENWDKPFLTSLNNCRLFVCDHLSTVQAEALAADKPTIMYWHPETVHLKQDVMPYYDELRLSGILYGTPEEAAEAVNSVYGDVEGWWNSPERQVVLKRFCDHFARKSVNAVNKWAVELESLAKNIGKEIQFNPERTIS